VKRINSKRLAVIIASAILVTGAGTYTGLLAGQNEQLRAVIASENARPTPTATVTMPPKVVTRTKTVIRTIPGPVRTLYRNGYPLISDNPAWNCAGAFYTAYVRLAQGGPAGDSGIWQELCPNVPQPAN
jgi:hypothetical protein